MDDNAFAGVTAIAAGVKSSAALKNGQIVLWGRSDDDSQQVAFSTIPTDGSYKAVALGANHGLAIRDNDGTVNAWGDDNMGQCYLTRYWGVGIKAIAAGKDFSLGLNETGRVFVARTTGDGDPSRITEIPAEVTNGVVDAIAAGPYHAMALKNGGVWVWGAWVEDSTTSSRHLPRSSFGYVTNVPDLAKSGVIQIAAGWNSCAALKEDGSIVIWGNEAGIGSVATSIPPCAANNVKEIALGRFHAMARTSYLPPALTSSTNLPDAYLESEYAVQIEAIGDPKPTFHEVNLKLPKGLSLNQETGLISGIPIPETTGTNYVEIAAANAYGEDSLKYRIIVHPRKTLPPTWITDSLPEAVLGEWYEVQLQATENPRYSVDPSLGPLPAWAELTPAGVIRGWPDSLAAAWPTFIASNEVGTSSRLLEMKTANPTNAPSVSGEGSLPDGIKGKPYSTNAIALPGGGLAFGCRLDIRGATGVQLVSGSLPTGLTWKGTNGIWWISGTPTVTGEFEFSLLASNPAGTTTGRWRIAVKGPPEWVTPAGALPEGRVGVGYRATVQANWATNYVRESGTWPAGLSLSLEESDTGKIGVISGTPTQETETPSVVGLSAVNAYGSTTPVRYFTISIVDKIIPELEWTGISRTGNAVILSWTNQTAADTTAWIGSTTNLVTGWETNASPAEAGWLKTNSPARLQELRSPCFYLLKPVD